MSGYIFDFGAKGKFSPNGKVDVADHDAHNNALERAELDAWATKPDRFVVYAPSKLPGDGRVSPLDRFQVTTWLGTPLGEVYWSRTTRNNFGARITSIRFRGTNGACYYGRFGSDWRQLVRVRKFK